MENDEQGNTFLDKWFIELENYTHIMKVTTTDVTWFKEVAVMIIIIGQGWR